MYGAYYVPIETRTLDVIVLHDSANEIDVLDSVIDEISAIEERFPEVDFSTVVLGRDQVNDDTLIGARRAF